MSAPPPGWPPAAQPAGPAPGVQFAGHGARLGAFIIDAILVGVVSFGSLVLDMAVIGVFAFLYFPFFWALGGATPGMKAAGIRVVNDRDGSRIGWGTALLRLVGWWISTAAFYFGFAWILIDSRRRGWHDLIAGTCVISTR